MYMYEVSVTLYAHIGHERFLYLKVPCTDLGQSRASAHMAAGFTRHFTVCTVQLHELHI